MKKLICSILLFGLVAQTWAINSSVLENRNSGLSTIPTIHQDDYSLLVIECEHGYEAYIISNGFRTLEPLGYVDGMSLYQGYFAEGFGLDPSGLVKWEDGKRSGKARTNVIMEKGDSLKDVAKFIKLDEGEFKKWLDKESLDQKHCNDRICNTAIRTWNVDDKLICGDVKLSVPNTIYAYLGDYGGFGVAYFLMRERKSFINSKRAAGFKVEGSIAKQKLLEADVASADIWGVGYFGHGVLGQLSLHGDSGGAGKLIDITNVTAKQHHKLGLALIYACQGARGRFTRIGLGGALNASNWISKYGSFRASWENIHPLFYGSWTNLPESPNGPPDSHDLHSEYPNMQ